MKRGGFYWKNNKPYASVTNIISVLDKPALSYWFGQQVYRAFAKDATLSEKDALKAPYNTSTSAADRGKTIHSIVESYKTIKDKIKVIEKYRPYANAFYTWAKQYNPNFIEREKEVFSNKYEYAGTLDGLLTLGDCPDKLILDVKTGKGIYPEVELQLSAYRQALQEEGVKVQDTAVLLLKEDGTYTFQVTGKDRLEEFLACKKIYDWRNEELIANMKNNKLKTKKEAK